MVQLMMAQEEGLHGKHIRQLQLQMLLVPEVEMLLTELVIIEI
jgi:hypothetical protein